MQFYIYCLIYLFQDLFHIHSYLFHSHIYLFIDLILTKMAFHIFLHAVEILYGISIKKRICSEGSNPRIHKRCSQLPQPVST